MEGKILWDIKQTSTTDTGTKLMQTTEIKAWCISIKQSKITRDN